MYSSINISININIKPRDISLKISFLEVLRNLPAFGSESIIMSSGFWFGMNVFLVALHVISVTNFNKLYLLTKKLKIAYVFFVTYIFQST